MPDPDAAAKAALARMPPRRDGCLWCGRRVEVVPPPRSWEPDRAAALAAQHAPGCEWVRMWWDRLAPPGAGPAP